MPRKRSKPPRKPDQTGVSVSQMNFDEVTKVMRPLVNEYFDLHRREMAKRDGQEWFVHDDLADLAEEIAKWMEYYAAVFRRNAGLFRSGRH